MVLPQLVTVPVNVMAPAFAHAAGANRGELNAGQIDLGIETLETAANAVYIVLMNVPNVPRRGEQRAIGLDILKADNIFDHVGIKIRFALVKVSAQQRDHVGQPVGCHNKRVNGGGIANDAPAVGYPVEYIDAVIKRVADVNVRNAGKQSNPQAAPAAIRGHSVGARCRGGKEQADQSGQP